MLAEYGMDSLDFGLWTWFVGVVSNRIHATAQKERKCKNDDYYTIILLTLFVMPACSV